MNTQFNSNVIWLQLEYKISTLGYVLCIYFRAFQNRVTFTTQEACSSSWRTRVFKDV